MKSDLDLFVEALNEKMPGGKSNAWQRFLFLSMCVVSGFFWFSVFIWGTTGFIINTLLFLCLYVLFKISYKSKKIRLIFNPSFIWGGKTFKFKNND